ncbi:MAG TPA: carboxyl transferase domain-containing protein [Anaeromyxobacter sp.]
MKQHTAKDEAVAELERRRALARGQGGPEKVAAQHAKGRLTARERVALLVEPGSFVEIGMLAHSDREEVGEAAPADAAITGVGLVDGRKVAVVAVDATVMAGTTGWVGSRKQGLLASLAVKRGYPLVCLGDANGGRIPDLLGSRFAGAIGSHEGEDFMGYRVQVDRVPRVTAALGNAYGDPSLWAAASDFVVLAEGCTVGLCGPSLVQASVGEKTTHEELGGVVTAAKTSGLVSLLAPDEPASIEAIKRFLSYLPSNSSLEPPRAAPQPPRTAGEALCDIVPDQINRAYDVHKVIDAVVDEGSFFELHALWGRSLVVGLARVEGRPVGILANQPMYQAGVLEATSLAKARKHVRLCKDFGLPLVFLEDLPGILIGTAAERSGVASRLMELFEALADVQVPRVTVILRKAFGFGLFVFGGPTMGSDYVCAWPNAQIGFMAAENAVRVLYRRRIAEAAEREGPEAAEHLARVLTTDIERDNAPWRAAALGYIHNVIRPEETRQAVIDGLFLASGYRDPRRQRRG